MVRIEPIPIAEGLTFYLNTASWESSTDSDGSRSFSLVGHQAEPQQGHWMFTSYRGMQAFYNVLCKVVYWFQINFYCTLFTTWNTLLLLLWNCSPSAKLHKRQCYHYPSKFPFETVWRRVQTVSWAWMTSESLFQAWVEAEHDRKSCTAAAHAVLRDRQSPALQGCPSLPWVLQVSLGLFTDKEKCVCWQQHSLFFCREYFLKVKQKRSSKNEQLYHYLMCWDLSRDHFKDPYCLQQLMSAASAEAVLSLKVLTYLQFSVLSLVLICHFKMNAPFVEANYLHEHCTSSKSQICFTFLLAATLYFAVHSTCTK